MHLIGAKPRSAETGETYWPFPNAINTPSRPRLLVWDLNSDVPGFQALTLDRRSFCITHAHIRAGFVRECINADYDLIIIRHALFCTAKERVTKLRKAGCRTPLLVVTEARRRKECVEILDAGADDFVLETIDSEELSARIRAVLRKTRWRLDDERPAYGRALHKGSADDLEDQRLTSLTLRELVVFRMLARRAGGYVSKLEMEQALFGGNIVHSNIIQTVIYGLRCKLGADNILTMRQVGYGLSASFVRQNANLLKCHF